MDFTAEDLLDAVERRVGQLLDAAGLAGPPVDCLMLAEVHFGQTVEYLPPDDEPRQYGDRPRPKFKPNTVLLKEDMTPEAMQILGARAVARKLLPDILQRLGVPREFETKGMTTQIANLVVPRLLLPTRWFAGDARRAGFDVLDLTKQYSTAGPETVLARILDVADDPMVVTLIDDGTVAGRKANRFPAGRKLLPAEEKCKDLVEATGKPAKARADGWTAWGWPTRGVPFRRILVRATPDDVY